MEPKKTRSSEQFDKEAAFVAAALAEVTRARAIFPENTHRIAALVEELGEATQALLDFEEGKTTTEHVMRELEQLGAMVIRLATEGDRSLKWRPEGHERDRASY
jgi:hypothetical protein